MQAVYLGWGYKITGKSLYIQDILIYLNSKGDLSYFGIILQER
jgi:hypothetical protein